MKCRPEEQGGIDPAGGCTNAEVEVRTRGAPARAHRADPLPFPHALSLRYHGFLEVVIDAEQAAPVVQHNGPSPEKLLAGERHGARRDRPHGRPRRKVEVHPRVGAAGFSIDHPAGAETSGPVILDRREERKIPGGRGDGGKPNLQLLRLPADPLEGTGVELRHFFRQGKHLDGKRPLPDRELQVKARGGTLPVPHHPKPRLSRGAPSGRSRSTQGPGRSRLSSRETYAPSRPSGGCREGERRKPPREPGR